MIRKHLTKLFDSADQFIEDSNWTTISVLKICLISLGFLLGVSTKKHKKLKGFFAFVLFAATCAPLVQKFAHIYKES